MRCSKCGSYIDDHENICPVCGTVVDFAEKSEVIQAEIGNKIDMFLNDKDENMQNIRDGVDMRDGHMDVQDTDGVSNTIRFKNADNDTVFKMHTVTAGKQQVEGDYGEEADHVIEDEYDFPDAPDKDADYEDYPAEGRRILSPGIIAAIAGGSVIVILIAVLLITGAFGRLFNNKEEETTTQETESVTEPTTVPDVITVSVRDGETYTAPLSITVTSQRKGTIYYSLDGTDPTKYSARYTGSVKITEKDITGDKQDFTLKVLTLDPSGAEIGSFEVHFTVEIAEIQPPVFSPGSGDYYSARTIQITAQEGAVIYYTYDGSQPTESSAVYSQPIVMKRGNNVLSAIAVKDGRSSEITQAVYDLVIESVISYDRALELITEHLEDEGYLPESEIRREETKETKESSETASTDESESSEETSSEAETEDEHEYYSVMSAGTAIIDEQQYYAFDIEIINSDKEILSSYYLGVEDQSGDITGLEKDGYSFYLSE